MENWRSDGRWKVDNGEGYDTGGICNALYEDLGGKLDQKCMEQLGSWRVPRVDLGQCELEMLGCILARSFCVDQKPLGIDLHPIVWGCLGWRWLWRLVGRFGQVRFGRVEPERVRFGQVRFGQVRFGQVRFGRVEPGRVTLETLARMWALLLIGSMDFVDK